MLSKPSDDIPALSEGDIDDLIKTFGHKKRDKKQKNVKKFYNSPAKQQQPAQISPTQATTAQIESDFQMLKTIKSVDIPITRKFESTKDIEVNGNDSEQKLTAPRKKSQSD